VVRGAPADPRSDLYAIGATLFWLMTGKPLFTGTVVEVLAAQEKRPVPSIASQVPGVGIGVVDVLYRLLQKDPVRRPQTAQEVVGLLDSVIERMARDTGVPQSVDSAPPARVDSPVPTRTGDSPFEAVAEPDQPFIGQPTGVMGTLKQMSVVDVLQTLEIGKKSARVDVHLGDGDKGTLHIHDGQIVHATTNTLTGEKAVFALVRKRDGLFRIHYEREACVTNVTRPTQFVLLEAMRQIDETAAPTTAAPTAAAPNKVAPQTPPTSIAAVSSHVHDPVPASPPVPLPSESANLVTSPELRPIAAVNARRLPPHVLNQKPVANARPLIDQLPPADPFGSDGGADGDTMRVADGNPLASDFARPLEEPTLPALRLASRIGPRTGAALRRAQQLLLRLDRLLSRQLRSVNSAVRAQVPVWNAHLEARFSPVRSRLAKVVPRLAQLPLWQLAVALLTVIGCAWMTTSALLARGAGHMSAADAMGAILDGQPHLVIASLEQVPVAALSPNQQLTLGHAYLAAGDGPSAWPHYHHALAAGVVDATLLRALVERLDVERPDDELDLLILWPDFELHDALLDHLYGPSVPARENAAVVLTERGSIGEFSPEVLARLDLNSAPNCVKRRAALAALRAIGKSEASRAAIEQVGREHPSCFSTELQNTYRTVADRLKDALDLR
jgi:hypothetical protein